ncbi:MAG: hypothetical protein PHU46_00770 [Rhodocyclaceae bacterium]|nr:hypothetical protein [Rhodocyclaceae bacterium]
MRIKNRWFRDNSPRGPKDIAGGGAFIAFRIAQNALKNMRKADFDIAPGSQYFSFLAEWLIFLVQIADRIAYERMEEDDRIEFTTAMANRLGDILEENRDDLVGREGGAEVGSFKGRFIGLLNQRGAEYASHGYGDDGPDYGFLRHLAYNLVAILDDRDKTWVHDQVMEIEAPDAAATMRRGVLGLLGEEPRPARRAGGTSGD